MWLVAGCGDGAQTENVVNTIDAELEVVESPGDGIPEIDDGDTNVEVDTVSSAELEVPAVEPAEPPSADYRPSERQSRQELAVTEIEELAEPTPDQAVAEPLADDDAEPFTIRADIGSFPDSIPVTVAGNDGTTTAVRDTAGSPTTPQLFDPTAPGGDAPIEAAVAQVDDELGGVEPVDPVLPVDGDESASENGPDPTIDDCVGIADCDPTSVAAGGDGQASSGAGESAASDDAPDCNERPWARGCPGPAPDHVGDSDIDAPFADTTEVDAETQEGVFVPQQIQDALLAPVEK